MLEKSAPLNTRAFVPPFSELWRSLIFFFSSFNFAGLPAGYKPEGLSSQNLLQYIYNGSASKVCLFRD